MIFKLSLAILVLAVAAQVQSIEIPEHDFDCRITSKVYRRTNRDYKISRTKRSCYTRWIKSKRSQDVNILFKSIQIDCNGNNDVEIIQADNSVASYCEQAGGVSSLNFPTDNSRWSLLVVRGQVNIVFRLTYEDAPATIPLLPVTNGPVVTNAPVTNGPVVTNAPVTNVPSNTCGRASFPPNESGLRIVGGFEANQNSWPWQALISDDSYICGASLINDRWLVTAAHCDFNINTFKAYLGDHYLSQGNKVVKVERFIPHPTYRSDDLYDIALIKLSESVTFTDKIKPVCLPNGRTEATGNTGIVTGWGTTTEGGNVAQALQQVSITVQQSSVCSSLQRFSSATSICAGESTGQVHDSCQGDSGGPFVMKDANSQFYLAGVVSSGVGCRGKGVYVRVSSFESWIAQTIASN